jgi:hypothetical protein
MVQGGGGDAAIAKNAVSPLLSGFLSASYLQSKTLQTLFAEGVPVKAFHTGGEGYPCKPLFSLEWTRSNSAFEATQRTILSDFHSDEWVDQKTPSPRQGNGRCECVQQDNLYLTVWGYWTMSDNWMPTAFAGAANTLWRKPPFPESKNAVRTVRIEWDVSGTSRFQVRLAQEEHSFRCAGSELARRILRVLSRGLYHFAIGFPLRLRLLLHCLFLLLARFFGSAVPVPRAGPLLTRAGPLLSRCRDCTANTQRAQKDKDSKSFHKLHGRFSH